MPYHSGPHREAPGSVRRQREEGRTVGKGVHGSFYGKEQVRQGKQI